MELFTITARKERMDKTKKIIEGILPISYVKAVSIVSMNVGIGDKTAREYIRTLAEFCGWIISDGMIRKPETI